MSEPPDAELAARVIATADTRAFETLVRRHQAHVRAYVRSQCLDASLADDAAHAPESPARRLHAARGKAKLRELLTEEVTHNGS